MSLCMHIYLSDLILAGAQDVLMCLALGSHLGTEVSVLSLPALTRSAYSNTLCQVLLSWWSDLECGSWGFCVPGYSKSFVPKARQGRWLTDDSQKVREHYPLSLKLIRLSSCH